MRRGMALLEISIDYQSAIGPMGIIGGKLVAKRSTRWLSSVARSESQRDSGSFANVEQSLKQACGTVCFAPGRPAKLRERAAQRHTFATPRYLCARVKCAGDARRRRGKFGRSYLPVVPEALGSEPTKREATVGRPPSDCVERERKVWRV